ncbi:AraC family transcriptional regulator [Pseudonocardia humida]|uniref:Helix-turn-helix transcriptional regulator n=1 Tax=Pseudonocardia humida TaxID=2800819 RepID=A0ABT1A4A3_9PSEU|nr:helix-turn-helix transcriptional regulator [Pseudonocardia humida]MCO1657810.1 helix-turn-helix transcriptional regulator [Pseudonocardia humida]
MSGSGHTAVLVADFPLARRTRFGRHRHRTHQLAWAAEGVVSITVEDAAWILPATRALWIPAGVPHSVDGGPAVVRAAYLHANPHGWTTPTPVAVSPLLRELSEHLTTDLPSSAARSRAEAVLLDLLDPVGTTSVRLPVPTDPRAAAVARAILRDPADDRGLEAWARTVGAGARTLARLFTAETGLSFGRWRTQARLRAALLLLADGVPVGVVAHRVGYRAPSAFVAAFHRQLGVPPGAYYAGR